MAPFPKSILINVYVQSTGAFITTWKNFQFGGYTKSLDGGLSECVIKLDKVFDYSGGDLILGNDIEVRISDKDTVVVAGNGSRIVYRGYISMIERNIDGHGEGVTVHVLGYYTLLALDILKNGSQTTLYSDTTNGLTTTSATAADIGLMMRGIITRYIAETTNPKISYNIDDIPNTSTTATYTFQQNTYREAMDVIKQMAPTGVFYYVDELGKVKFKSKPTTPTHKFVFGRHFKKVHVQHSLEKVRNVALIWDGVTSYIHYNDEDSIASFGRKVERFVDHGLSSAASALKGARFLADNAKPDVRVTCTILDNNGDDNMGYDIESIQPGDTCSFYGFATGFDTIFNDNMIITEVSYNLDYAEVTVEIIKSTLIEEQQNQQRDISDVTNAVGSIPASYS